ncbi:MAG: serine/threonine protein kinase [Alphaproteobacteria bacterium]|nr:serine/threonine protein kinase [Alphaproteobacteria bacterium]MCB9692696.1 serine/threonine protein kinase [Alphaproteobacteria bacterium]
MRQLRVDDTIGDWVVEAPLGQGGMGSVYRCHNALAPRIRAAVKVVHELPGEDSADRERFVREVEALEGLQHPAIVRVKGWGATDDGVLWLAMDLVEGEDLAARLARGPLDPDTARRTFRDIAAGLAHAHGREVFHRDIKPANVLLLEDGSARIVDFGIAFHDGRTRLSMAGIIPGTPAYLAPEVFGGIPVPRALDVYAFGQMLAEALTGQPAFPEPDGLTTTQRIAHVAGRKLAGAPLDAPGAPADLRAIVQATTHPDPTLRQLDMDLVVAAFDGEPLPTVHRPETLSFEWDTVAPELATLGDEPPEPPLATALPEELPESGTLASVPAPAPVAAERDARPFAVVVTAVLALSLLALFALRPTGPTPRGLVVTGVPADVPLAVWFDGERVQPEDGRYARLADGPVAAFAAAGAHCDVDGLTPGACGPCCACGTATITEPFGTLALAAPTTPAVIGVTVGDAPDARVEVDGVPARPTGPGAFAAEVAPGAHTVEVVRGTCAPEARGCGGTCPVGCRSVVREVTVACHARQDVPVEAAPPEEPAAPAPAATALAGKRVKILYMRGERDVAIALERAFTREGASVTVEPSENAPREYFGRVVPIGLQSTPAAERAARAGHRWSRGVVEEATGNAEVPFDVVFWAARS